MKKTLIVLLFLLMLNFAFGQKGQIIYTEFEPSLWVDYTPYEDSIGHTLYIDIDHNGNNELSFYALLRWGHVCDLYFRRTDWHGENEDWKYRVPYQLFDEDDAVPLVDTIHFADTIANINEETWCPAYRFSYWPEQPPCAVGPDDHFYLSVRKAVEGGYCYGWIDLNIYFPPDNWLDHFHIYLTIYRMVYCTIPNYPLMVGQTDFAWDVDESGTVGFAVVQPNPTDGQVTVWGKDLSRAEVFNALGQHVASTSGQGERLVIRLDVQPAGIYFIEVTDTQGRRCVKKVMKQ